MSKPVSRQDVPQNAVEHEFMQIVEEGRTMLRNGPFGFVPPGIIMRDAETGEPICDLTDADILQRFRAWSRAYAAKQQR